MNLDKINKSQYTILAIGAILINALLFASLKIYLSIKDAATPLLDKAAEGNPINTSEIQSLFTSLQKNIIVTYFILTGFVIVIIIAGFIFLRDKVYSRNNTGENFEEDDIKEPFYDSDAFEEAAATTDDAEPIFNPFHNKSKSQAMDSCLVMATPKADIKRLKQPKKLKNKINIQFKIKPLIFLSAALIFIYILYILFAPSYYKARASKMQETGKYSEAVSLYDKAIKFKSKSPELYYGKGISLSKSGNYEEAVQCYSKSINLNQKYYDAYYNKGIALTNLGESDNALYNFDMAIKLEPMKIQTYEAKAKLLEELKRYDEALKCYKIIYDLDPNNKDIKAKIDNLNPEDAPNSFEPVVIYQNQTGTELDKTIFRVIVKGNQQIALTGKNKAMNYAVSNFTGDVVIQSVDNKHSEKLFIAVNSSSAIGIKPDANHLTVKNKLIVTGRAQVPENKFEAHLIDNTGNTILRFGVNIQPDNEDGEGPFAIDIPVENSKINEKIGYLAFIQKSIGDGSKVEILKIPVKFE